MAFPASTDRISAPGVAREQHPWWWWMPWVNSWRPTASPPLHFAAAAWWPLGGQNILEAAVWGIPVFFGPSMEDFLDAKALLDASGGGIQVADGRELADKILYYLNHPEKAAAAGQLARKVVAAGSGAAEKHADVICRALASPL